MARTAPTYVGEFTETEATGGTSRVTGTLAVQAGDMLVAGLASENGGFFSAFVTATGGSLTWTARQDVGTTSTSAKSALHTATVDANKSMAITCTQTVSGWWGIDGLAFRGSDGVGASAGAANIAQGAASQAITTTQDNSALVVCIVDWNASDPTTWTHRQVNGQNPVVLTAKQVGSGSYSYAFLYYADAGTAGAKTVGTTAPTTSTYATTVVEILGTTVVTPTAVSLGATVAPSGSSATKTHTTTAAIPAGAYAVIVAGHFSSNAAQATAASMSAGGLTFVKDSALAGASNYDLSVWRSTTPAASTIASGTTCTVTFTPNATLGTMVGAAYMTALDTSASPFDGTNGAWRTTGAATTQAWNTGNVTPSRSGGLALAAAFVDGTANGGQSTPTAPALELWDVNNTAEGWGLVLEWRDSTVSGTPVSLGGSWNQDPSFGDGVVIVAYKGVGSAPATAAGQYGWGTYGAGDYGPNFGGAASTPVVGVEAFSQSEGATVIAVTLDALESHAQSEGASSLAISLAATDSWVVSDSVTTLATALAANDAASLSDSSQSTVAIVAAESFSLAELSAILSNMGVTDSWALTDSSAASQLLTLTASDSWTLTDSSSLLVQQLLSTSDSWLVAEASAIAAALNPTDTHTQSEGTTSLAAAINAVDAGIFADSSSLANSLATTDSWSLSEAASLAIALATTDTLALTDLVTLLTAALDATESGTLTEAAVMQSVNLIVGSDSWTLTDVSALTTTDLKSANDSTTLNEALTIAATLVATETHTLTDLVSALTAALSAVDSWAMSEAAGSLFQFTAVSASEAFALAEAASLANTLATNETHTITDAAAVAAALSVSDSSTLTDASSKVETWFINAIETYNLTELASMAESRFLTAFDSTTLTEVSAAIATALVASDTFNFTEFASQSGQGAPYLHSRPPLSGLLDEAILDGFVQAYVSDGDIAAAEAFGAVANAVATALMASSVASGLPVDATADGDAVPYLGNATGIGVDFTTNGDIADRTATGAADYTGQGAVSDASAYGAVLDQQSAADVAGATSEGDPVDHIADGAGADAEAAGVEV